MTADELADEEAARKAADVFGSTFGPSSIGVAPPAPPPPSSRVLDLASQYDAEQQAARQQQAKASARQAREIDDLLNQGRDSQGASLVMGAASGGWEQLTNTLKAAGAPALYGAAKVGRAIHGLTGGAPIEDQPGQASDLGGALRDLAAPAKGLVRMAVEADDSTPVPDWLKTDESQTLTGKVAGLGREALQAAADPNNDLTAAERTSLNRRAMAAPAAELLAQPNPVGPLTGHTGLLDAPAYWAGKQVARGVERIGGPNPTLGEALGGLGRGTGRAMDAAFAEPPGSSRFAFDPRRGAIDLGKGPLRPEDEALKRVIDAADRIAGVKNHLAENIPQAKQDMLDAMLGPATASNESVMAHAAMSNPELENALRANLREGMQASRRQIPGVSLDQPAPSGSGTLGDMAADGERDFSLASSGPKTEQVRAARGLTDEEKALNASSAKRAFADAKVDDDAFTTMFNRLDAADAIRLARDVGAAPGRSKQSALKAALEARGRLQEMKPAPTTPEGLQVHEEFDQLEKAKQAAARGPQPDAAPPTSESVPPPPDIPVYEPAPFGPEGPHTEPPTTAQQIKGAIGQLGGGIAEEGYKKMFASLQAGTNDFAHMKKFPEIKQAFDEGRIASPEELQRFVKGAYAPPTTEPPPRPMRQGFTTEKGSTYTVHPDGTTTRNKAARDLPGHEGDFGAKERSAKTVYVPADVARALSSAGLSGVEDTAVVLRDGKATLATKSPGGQWGATPSGRDVPFATEPQVGYAPLELWKPRGDFAGEAYGKMHAGSKITEITEPPPRPAGVEGFSSPAQGAPNGEVQVPGPSGGGPPVEQAPGVQAQVAAEGHAPDVNAPQGQEVGPGLLDQAPGGSPTAPAAPPPSPSAPGGGGPFGPMTRPVDYEIGSGVSKTYNPHAGPELDVPGATPPGATTRDVAPRRPPPIPDYSSEADRGDVAGGLYKTTLDSLRAFGRDSAGARELAARAQETLGQATRWAADPARGNVAQTYRVMDSIVGKERSIQNPFPSWNPMTWRSPVARTQPVVEQLVEPIASAKSPELQYSRLKVRLDADARRAAGASDAAQYQFDGAAKDFEDEARRQVYATGQYAEDANVVRQGPGGKAVPFKAAADRERMPSDLILSHDWMARGNPEGDRFAEAFLSEPGNPGFTKDNLDKFWGELEAIRANPESEAGYEFHRVYKSIPDYYVATDGVRYPIDRILGDWIPNGANPHGNLATWAKEEVTRAEWINQVGQRGFSDPSVLDNLTGERGLMTQIGAELPPAQAQAAVDAAEKAIAALHGQGRMAGFGYYQGPRVLPWYAKLAGAGADLAKTLQLSYASYRHLMGGFMSVPARAPSLALIPRATATTAGELGRLASGELLRGLSNVPGLGVLRRAADAIGPEAEEIVAQLGHVHGDFMEGMSHYGDAIGSPLSGTPAGDAGLLPRLAKQDVRETAGDLFALASAPVEQTLRVTQGLRDALAGRMGQRYAAWAADLANRGDLSDTQMVRFRRDNLSPTMLEKMRSGRMTADDVEQFGKELGLATAKQTQMGARGPLERSKWLNDKVANKLWSFLSYSFGIGREQVESLNLVHTVMTNPELSYADKLKAVGDEMARVGVRMLGAQPVGYMNRKLAELGGREDSEWEQTHPFVGKFFSNLLYSQFFGPAAAIADFVMQHGHVQRPYAGTYGGRPEKAHEIVDPWLAKFANAAADAVSPALTYPGRLVAPSVEDPAKPEGDEAWDRLARGVNSIPAVRGAESLALGPDAARELRQAARASVFPSKAGGVFGGGKESVFGSKRGGDQPPASKPSVFGSKRPSVFKSKR